jgi:hypothetical protein
MIHFNIITLSTVGKLCYCDDGGQWRLVTSRAIGAASN